MYDTRYCEEQEAKYLAALKIVAITPNDIALDIGCGTGMLFQHLVDKVKVVVGLDISMELLIQAKKKAKPFANVLLVLADADHMPFRPEVFDYVFAFTILQNMPNPAVTLKNLQLSSRKNASYIVTALKPAISLEKFGLFLKRAELLVDSLINEENLHCYIVKAVSQKKL